MYDISDSLESDSLKKKLEQIAKVFDLDNLTSVAVDSEYIRSYYRVNKLPYSIFHNRSNFVHMGISRDGVYKHDDLLEQAKFVSRHIDEMQANNVLELAAGRGANSLWLARRHPNTSFVAIDVSESHVLMAIKSANKQNNLNVALGNFHNLAQQKSDTFDIVFVIEALCHSQDTEQVLLESLRVLKPSGRLIVFDGYLGSRTLTEREKVAAKITERGMAVSEFRTYEYFKSKADKSGFELLQEENLSTFVIPTMLRFESMASRFFKRPRLGKIIVKILPQEFTHNATSGLLMPILMKTGVFEY